MFPRSIKLIQGSSIIASTGDLSLDQSVDIDCSATLAELEAGQDLDRGPGQGRQAENEHGDEGELNESCQICGKLVMSYYLFCCGKI